MFPELLLTMFLELGWMPLNGTSLYETGGGTTRVDTSKSFYTELDAEMEWSYLYLGGSVKTHIHPIKLNNWYPFRSDYEVRAGLRFDPITLGFRHVCIHPIVPYFGTIKPLDKVKDIAYEEVFVRFTIGGE